MSFRGKLIAKLFYTFANINPEVKDTGAAMKKMLDGLDHGKQAKGFRYTAAVGNGTRYVHVRKEGGTPNGNLIFYIHGGGFYNGLSDSYRMMAKDFYEANGAETILADYSLLPESKYPKQPQEILALWEYIVDELGYKEENIMVGGDSAGGNLTLNLLLQLRNRGSKMPKAAFLLSPWTDMAGTGESYVNNYQKDPFFGRRNRKLTEEKKITMMDCSLYDYAKGNDRFDPLLSPVYADYNGFPPTFFAVGGDEMLLSDALTIERKLRENGIETELAIGEGMFHVYPLFASLIPEAKRDFAKMTAFIKRHSEQA